jgi:hypothetical protein
MKHHALLIALLVCGQAFPFDALAQKWGTPQEPARSRAQSERDLETNGVQQRDVRPRHHPTTQTETQSQPRTQQAQPTDKRWGAADTRSPEMQRCDNLRNQLEQVMRAEQRGGTTGTMNQLATRRQQIFEAKQKAGC